MHRATAIAEVAAELANAATLESLPEIVLRGAQVLGAQASAMAVFDSEGGPLRLHLTSGLPDEIQGYVDYAVRGLEIELDDTQATQYAAMHGRRVLLADREEALARFPTMREGLEVLNFSAVAALPLRVEDDEDLQRRARRRTKGTRKTKRPAEKSKLPLMIGGGVLAMVLIVIAVSLTVRGNILLSTQIYNLMVSERLLATLAGFFSVAALLLASVGLYGVIHFAAAQRTREIGIRIALGARRGSVVRMMVADTSVPVIAGVAAGIGGGTALARYLASQLFGVKPTDFWSLASPVACILVAAAAAALPPAVREGAAFPGGTSSPPLPRLRRRPL